MANIVRCEMPDGVHRFKPFTVADYRDLLLVRNDMNNKPVEEQKQLLDELLEDYRKLVMRKCIMFLEKLIQKPVML